MTLLTSPPVTLLLRTTLLLGLALLAVRLLRGPAVQTLAGRGALAAVALLLLTAPLTKFVPPLWHVPAPAAPRPAAPVPVVVLTPVVPPPQFWGAGIGTEKGASPAPTPPPPPNPSFRKDPAKQGGRSPNPPYGGPLLLVLWTTGTGLLLLWLAACQWHLTRLHRRAIPLTGGPAYDTLAALTPNPPRLYACPGIDGPFLAGLLRPAIYLPTDHADTFSPDALRAVLAHELAHAERRDTRWTLASRLLCALLWPQPLLWLLCRHLDHISEDACDLAVLSQACPPRVYADCLLTLAERRPLSRRTSPLTAGLVPFRSQLARRIQHILTTKGELPMPAITRRLRLTIAAATVLVALGGTLLISAAPAQVAPASWRPFSADAAHPLIGMWLFKSQPISGSKDMIALYRKDGQYEYLSSGTAWHDPSQAFGTYTVDGHTLTEQGTLASFEDPARRGHSRLLASQSPPSTVHFGISGGKLTLQDPTGEVSVAERVSDNAQADLFQKMLGGSKDNPQSQPKDPTQAYQAEFLGDPPTPAFSPTLVGIWSGKPVPTAKQNDTIVFSPQGEVASIEQDGSQFEYGHYQIDKAVLTVKMAGPFFDNHHKRIGFAQNTQIAMTYSIAQGILTLKHTGAAIMTARRVSDYPVGLPIEDVATQQAGLTKAELPMPGLASPSEAQLLAGLTPVQGPGVVVTFRDADGVAFPPNMTPANVDHAMTINTLVGELKAAGAEAVTVNDQRLVATSSVRVSGSTLLVNDAPITGPFVIKAIGDSKKLLAAMNQSDPRSMVAQAKNNSPIVFMALQDERLTLPAYHATALPQFARLAP